MDRYLLLPHNERNRLYNSVLEESHPDAEYWAMLVLSGLIALFGLLQNSSGVVIGAMLISPLMNPILSAALALILGDGNLGSKSALVLAPSIAGVILITWGVTWLSPLKEATPEILARTNPNLHDLFIAFLSGLAGTLALRGGSTAMRVVPGVAIAVAVVPPLAVVGFGLGTRHWANAGGAFLLFMTNLVAIMLSASLVFRLFGFRAHEETEKGHLKLKYRLAISGLVLASLSIPLAQTLRNAARQIRLRTEIARVLDHAFKTDHSSVAELSFYRSQDKLSVRATLRAARYFETPEIEAAEDSLRRQLGSDTHLDVEQIIITRGGFTPPNAVAPGSAISGGVVRPLPGIEEAPFHFESNQKSLLMHLQKQVDVVLAGTPICRAGALRLQLGAGEPVVLALRLASPEPLGSQTVKLLASQLGAKISSPVELHGEVGLQGPDYGLVLESADLRRTLSKEDRKVIEKFVGSVRGRLDLRLQVTLISTTPEGDEARTSPLWRQVRAIMARSGLTAHQWTMKVAPTGEAKKSTGLEQTEEAKARLGATLSEPSAASPAVRCEFKVYQDF